MSNAEKIRSQLDTPEFWGKNVIAPNSKLENFWEFIAYLWYQKKVTLTKFENLFCEVDKIQFPVTLHSATESCVLVDSLGKKYIFDITSSQSLFKYKYSILEANDHKTLGWYFRADSGKLYLSKTSYSTNESNISYTYEIETAEIVAIFKKENYTVKIVYPDFGHNKELEYLIWEILSQYFINNLSFNNVFNAFSKLVDMFKKANLEISNLKISSSGPDKDIPLLSKIELKEGFVEKYIFTLSPDSSWSLLYKQNNRNNRKLLKDFLQSQF